MDSIFQGNNSTLGCLSTDKAIILAGDDCNESQPRRSFLYKSIEGEYFLEIISKIPGEQKVLYPVSEQHARSIYGGLPNKRIPPYEAFTQVKRYAA